MSRFTLFMGKEHNGALVSLKCFDSVLVYLNFLNSNLIAFKLTKSTLMVFWS